MHTFLWTAGGTIGTQESMPKPTCTRPSAHLIYMFIKLKSLSIMSTYILHAIGVCTELLGL